jgi:predicted transcriptional regulator
MIVTHERLRDRVEAILPDREDFARSTWDLAIWLGATQDQIESALMSLKRFGAVQRKLQTVKTGRASNTTRWVWWRAA